MVEEWVWLVTNGAFAFDGLYEQGLPIPEYRQGIVCISHSFGGGTEYPAKLRKHVKKERI